MRETKKTKQRRVWMEIYLLSKLEQNETAGLKKRIIITRGLWTVEWHSTWTRRTMHGVYERPHVRERSSSGDRASRGQCARIDLDERWQCVRIKFKTRNTSKCRWRALLPRAHVVIYFSDAPRECTSRPSWHSAGTSIYAFFTHVHWFYDTSDRVLKPNWLIYSTSYNRQTITASQLSLTRPGQWTITINPFYPVPIHFYHFQFWHDFSQFFRVVFLLIVLS